jgi:hypothetical protein
MRRWIYSAMAALVGLGLIATILLATGVLRHNEAVACSKLAVPPGHGPLVGGQKATIARAQSVVRFPVLIPDAPAARLSNLTQTWVDSQRHVALVFARGKVTITMVPAIYGNAGKEFRRFIAQNNATAVIGHVHRQPALVITPSTDACGANPAWVEFKHNGIDVNIYSTSYGTSTLVSVADTLRPGHRLPIISRPNQQ